MDGVHDLGGMDGLGPVHVEADEPVFHEPWEGIVHALLIALGAQDVFNVHEFRHARERADPAHYLEASYYELGLTGIEMLLVEKGVLDPEDIHDRTDTVAGNAESAVPDREDPALVEAVTEAIYHQSDSPAREPQDPRFEAGDRVVVRNDHPPGHTRSPRYARRASGIVDRVYDTYPVPDALAHGQQAAEPLYNVRFDADELWGPNAEGGVVHLDLWERYLDPKEASTQP